MKTALIVLSVVAMSGAVSLAEQAHFDLMQGRDQPVCKAYQAFLNGSNLASSPICGRPDTPSAAGFEALPRIFLSKDEIYQLADGLLGFADHDDSHYYDNLLAERKEFCAKPANARLCEGRGDRSSTIPWGGKNGLAYFAGSSAWMFDPQVDIDNDSKPDPVLLMRISPCTGNASDGVRATSSTYAFILDGELKAIDELRTRRVFGHPFNEWPRGRQNARFRFIGGSFGVFRYEATTYFDTFLSNWSDFKNERVDDSALLTTLGVFMHREGVTRQVCEIRWREVRLRAQ
jgi:hypothetical protein